VSRIVWRLGSNHGPVERAELSGYHHCVVQDGQLLGRSNVLHCGFGALMRGGWYVLCFVHFASW
jgi:hypothetical protein